MDLTRKAISGVVVLEPLLRRGVAGCVSEPYHTLRLAIDLRRGAPSIGKRGGAELSDKRQPQLLVPQGFTRGFVVFGDVADASQQTTD